MHLSKCGLSGFKSARSTVSREAIGSVKGHVQIYSCYQTWRVESVWTTWSGYSRRSVAGDSLSQMCSQQQGNVCSIQVRGRAWVEHAGGRTGQKFRTITSVGPYHRKPLAIVDIFICVFYMYDTTFLSSVIRDLFQVFYSFGVCSWWILWIFSCCILT